MPDAQAGDTAGNWSIFQFTSKQDDAWAFKWHDGTDVPPPAAGDWIVINDTPLRSDHNEVKKALAVLTGTPAGFNYALCSYLSAETPEGKKSFPAQYTLK
eukprot:TRINITY_DN21479_c0_g1_i1.p2 TRINITY_DN21479_c0_g1~~TRINITY_DN21479_c0_g1_i1.p2  ORF type:complete len:100 (+),score=14.51 TRINITY_DN21479_c0_g1_i1:326-625(+)